MNVSSALKSLLFLTAFAVAGCTGGAGTSLSLPASPTSVRTAKAPPPCVPTVWASSLSSNAVYGYTAASSPPCKTLTGPFNGLNINAPIALAIGKAPKRLYVADLNNNRILVFTYNGTFVKWLSTAYAGQVYQPWGVCVSPKGVVGVGNRQYNNTGAFGNVLFFSPGVPNGGTATGDASAVLASDQFCAFDKNNNFFVDGTAFGGGQKIAYLARAFVNLPGKTLVDPGLGSASFWVGMYSRIDAPVDDTLSVGTSVGNSTTETIMNWTVAGPAVGPLTFTPLPSYTLTGYPSTVDAVYQLAPTTGGNGGTVYVADYGASDVLSAPANGGATAVYNGVGGTVGVATRPTGQY